MSEDPIFYDLLHILKRAIRGSFVEFRIDGHHHVAPFEDLFIKGEVATVTHPDVSVDYGDGKYVDMRDNEPRTHSFNFLTSPFSWIGEPSFKDGHVCVTTPNRPLHIFLDGHAEVA